MSGYSSSFVDIYAEKGTELSDDVLRLWVYFNSSLCWLVREIAGRKNLGGGMLKAEAVDLQPFATYFCFRDIEKCRMLFDMSRGQLINNAQAEVQTELHKEIDKIVFDHIDLSEDERNYVVNMLLEKVKSRYSKTTAK